MALEAGVSEEEAPAIPGPGISTASDQAAARATFEDLAVPYMAEVRGVMMELQWENVQSNWFDIARPLLRSLRKMAEAVDHTALCEALDRFDKAIAEVLAPGQPPSPSPADGPSRTRAPSDRFAGRGSSRCCRSPSSWCGWARSRSASAWTNCRSPRRSTRSSASSARPSRRSAPRAAPPLRRPPPPLPLPSRPDQRRNDG